jgi:hypothetical protein
MRKAAGFFISVKKIKAREFYPTTLSNATRGFELAAIWRIRQTARSLPKKSEKGFAL